jgi:hypothetical protein
VLEVTLQQGEGEGLCVTVKMQMEADKMQKCYENLKYWQMGAWTWWIELQEVY